MIPIIPEQAFFAGCFKNANPGQLAAIQSFPAENDCTHSCADVLNIILVNERADRTNGCKLIQMPPSAKLFNFRVNRPIDGYETVHCGSV